MRLALPPTLIPALREKLRVLDSIPKPLRLAVLGSTAVWLTGFVAIGIFSLIHSPDHPKEETAHAVPGHETHAVKPASNGHEVVVAETHVENITLIPDESRPSNLEALRRLIGFYAENGDYRQAIPFVEEAMLRGLDDQEFLLNAARVFLAAGRNERALTAARGALSRDSGQVELWRIASMSLFRSGHVKEGVAMAQQALLRFGDLPDLMLDLATMEVEWGPAHPDYGKTLAKLLAKDPMSPPGLYLLGRKNSLAGNFGDAEAAFRKAMLADPNYAKAWAQLGVVLYQQDKLDEAGEWMIGALRRNPKDYNTWYSLGEWYLRRVEVEASPEAARQLRAKALQSFLKATELNEAHAEAQYRVGVLMHGNAQYKEAIRHFEASLKVDSTRAAAWFQMGVAYERIAHVEEARICVRRAFALEPLNPVVIAKLRELT